MTLPGASVGTNAKLRLGALLVFGFVVLQAVRDVYLGGVFQVVDFVEVIPPIFFICSLGFGLQVALSAPAEFGILARAWPKVLILNLLTAGAWFCYFFALETLEPAIVNTLHEGVGPATILGLSLFGLMANDKIRGREWLCHGGIVAALAFLCIIVLSDLSGFTRIAAMKTAPQLSAAVLSGVFIAMGIVVSKHLNNAGVSAGGILAVRFLALIVLAAFLSDDWFRLSDPGYLQVLALGSVLTIGPIYLFHKGIVLTSPLTVAVITATGPGIIFLLQLVDERISYSTFSLLGIGAYSLFVFSASFVRLNKK